MLFANSGDKCFKFYAVGKCVFREVVIELYNTHEEADTRIYFHLFSVMPFSNVVIRTDDIDCLIISLGIQSKLDESINVWLEVGKQSKNSLRYIDVKELARKLGMNLVKAIPAFHAFTGSDYRASFSRKGKVWPFQILEKSIAFQELFSNLSTDVIITDDVYAAIEEFVCTMYGMRKLKSVNQARLEIFIGMHKQKKEGKISCSKIKNMDGR